MEIQKLTRLKSMIIYCIHIMDVSSSLTTLFSSVSFFPMLRESHQIPTERLYLNKAPNVPF